MLGNPSENSEFDVRNGALEGHQEEYSEMAEPAQARYVMILDTVGMVEW